MFQRTHANVPVFHPAQGSPQVLQLHPPATGDPRPTKYTSASLILYLELWVLAGSVCVHECLQVCIKSVNWWTAFNFHPKCSKPTIHNPAASQASSRLWKKCLEIKPVISKLASPEFTSYMLVYVGLWLVKKNNSGQFLCYSFVLRSSAHGYLSLWFKVVALSSLGMNSIDNIKSAFRVPSAHAIMKLTMS